MSTDARNIARDRTEGTAFDLPAADGTALGATLYEPRGSARGNLVIHAAMAVPQSFYARFARDLADHDVRVLTYDYRGVGASRCGSLRGDETRLLDWALLDARGVLDWAKERYPGEPLAVLGHSFGGQLIGLLDDLASVDAAVLVASQLGWYGHWPLAYRFPLAVMWRAWVPAVTAVAGYLPGGVGLSRDLPAGVARDWARWCSHPEYLIGFEPGARERFARFARPTLLYSFTDDFYAPGPAVDALERALSGAHLVHRRFRPAGLGCDAVGHFGFFRPGLEDTLWAETRDFLEATLAGHPPPLAPTRPRWLDVDLTLPDLMADLQSGRS